MQLEFEIRNAGLAVFEEANDSAHEVKGGDVRRDLTALKAETELIRWLA